MPKIEPGRMKKCDRIEITCAGNGPKRSCHGGFEIGPGCRMAPIPDPAGYINRREVRQTIQILYHKFGTHCGLNQIFLPVEWHLPGKCRTFKTAAENAAVYFGWSQNTSK